MPLHSGFKVPVIVRKITSHIDIESSVSLILGLQSDIGLTEGIPLWEPTPDCRVYFFGTDYGGAEGFYDVQFFMNNVFADIQYKNNMMEFPTADLILLEQDEIDYVLIGLDEFRYRHISVMLAL
jgi:hypothetical protein